MKIFKKRTKKTKEPFKCPHKGDILCDKYGCPNDPNWKGDGCK